MLFKFVTTSLKFYLDDHLSLVDLSVHGRFEFDYQEGAVRPLGQELPRLG